MRATKLSRGTSSDSMTSNNRVRLYNGVMLNVFFFTIELTDSSVGYIYKAKIRPILQTRISSITLDQLPRVRDLYN